MSMPISVKRKDGGKIPGPANVPSVVEIRCQVQLPNQKISSMFFHGSFATPPSSMQAVASALWTSLSSAWSTNLAPLMATTTLFQSVWCRDMTSFANPIYQGTGTALPGTSASPAMPVNNAIVMTENVAARGKGIKGRVYIG